MSIVIGFDVMGANLGRVPAGAQLAGYSTGSGDVPWTAEEWAAHPGAVRICQDAGASDVTADVLDVERGAATIADTAPWYKAAASSYAGAHRPGQRHPAVYASQSNVTPLVNALTAAGIKSGPGLIIANWSLTETQAAADVLAAAGPFPVVGVQFASNQFFDTDAWSSSWLSDVSAAVKPPAPPQAPGTIYGPASAGTGYRWVADGTMSLEAFAAARGARALGLLKASAENLDATNYTALNAYIAGPGVAAKMPFGLVFYTASA